MSSRIKIPNFSKSIKKMTRKKNIKLSFVVIGLMDFVSLEATVIMPMGRMN
jgi:hypothetical protein